MQISQTIEEGTFPNSLYKATIALISKHYKRGQLQTKIPHQHSNKDLQNNSKFNSNMYKYV